MKSTLALTLAIVAGSVLAACSSPGGDAAQDPETPAASTTTAASAPAAAGDMTAQDGDLVEVHYVGTLDDGSRFDSSRDRGQPLTFVVGTGQVIPGFDDAVRGLRVGDVTTVRIPPEDAYGDKSEDLILELPYGPSQEDVSPGDQVTLSNGAPAVVLEVREDTVLLDANHPLAGEALTFEIELVSITRE